jgi:prolipoprotein diacylglyceryltransferase
MLASIPSPSSNGFSVGPVFFHAYGLCYVVAVAAAVWICSRRWEALGGSRELVQECAVWGFPAGILGGRLYHDCAAPAILVAQAIGRVGNYFNQELYGGPTSLPWGLEIDPAHRPANYLQATTFQPTFLYELIWNLLLAGALVLLGKRRKIRPPGLFALYVVGYSAFRIFEETLRVDPAHHLFGLRLNLYVAAVVALVGLAWFVRTQRGPASGATPAAAR